MNMVMMTIMMTGSIKDMGVTGIDWHQSINISTSSLS